MPQQTLVGRPQVGCKSSHACEYSPSASPDKLRSHPVVAQNFSCAHAVGRTLWLFCGSDRGAQRAAVAYSQIQIYRLNYVDPDAWLADVLARIADYPFIRLDELLS